MNEQFYPYDDEWVRVDLAGPVDQSQRTLPEGVDVHELLELVITRLKTGERTNVSLSPGTALKAGGWATVGADQGSFLVIVLRSKGYRIMLGDTAIVTELKLEPILQIAQSPNRKLVALASFTDIVVLTELGVVFDKGVASDGIRALVCSDNGASWQGWQSDVNQWVDGQASFWIQ